jgi:hypothetical protein
VLGHLTVSALFSYVTNTQAKQQKSEKQRLVGLTPGNTNEWENFTYHQPTDMQA